MQIESSGRPTILVVGATGAQGGSVARHLIAAGRWNVRALTRDPDSPNARGLRAAGVEVVRGDLARPTTIRAALRGVQAVYGLTSFWEHFAGEYEHGRNLIEAVAATAEVRHFVFSTLASPKRISAGTLSVPHYDLKARLETEARALGLAATFVHVAFYYENLLWLVPPVRRADGSLLFAFPQGDAPLAAVGVEDVGGVVARIFERPSEYIGRTVHVVGDEMPMADYAAALSRTLDTIVRYAHVDREEYARRNTPAAEELADMFDYFRRFVPSRASSIARCRALYPQLRDFTAWLATHAELFQRTLAA